MKNCVFSKNNPAVLVSTVWCTEQTVRGRAEHLAHVHHPGLNQQETGRAECSDGLEVTLEEVSKSPFGARTICSAWRSFPYWFRSLMHPLWIYSYNTPSNMLHSNNKVFFFFFFFGAENQKAFTATASITCGPGGPAARSSALLKLRVDIRRLFMRICSVQTEMDSRTKSLKRIPTFQCVFFFLNSCTITQRPSVALEGMGDRSPTDSDPTRSTRSSIPEGLLDSLRCNVMDILTFQVWRRLSIYLFCPFWKGEPGPARLVPVKSKILVPLLLV